MLEINSAISSCHRIDNCADDATAALPRERFSPMATEPTKPAIRREARYLRKNRTYGPAGGRSEIRRTTEVKTERRNSEEAKACIRRAWDAHGKRDHASIHLNVG